jgi:anaerobic C4-dicarboxylate transporter
VHEVAAACGEDYVVESSKRMMRKSPKLLTVIDRVLDNVGLHSMDLAYRRTT